MNIDKLILEAKKKGKKVNPWAVCTASVGGKIGSTERSEWTKSQAEKYERCVQDVKKKQKIKENISLNEVGGYDDPSMFAMHAGGQTGHLKGSYNALSEILNHLNKIGSEAVIDDDLKMEIDNFLSRVEGPMKNLSKAIINFEKKNLGNLRGGRPTPRDLEESFFFDKAILTEQQLNETLLNEGWKDVLLGIALLTGVGLGSAQAQNAKQALSKDEVRNKIEATLQDTTTLNKITKNLSPDVKDRIFKNADKALENLESKKGRVTSTVKVKDEKQLASKLKQGYALTGTETELDTIKGKDTVIVYTESLDFSLNSDGMFVTGGYQLSPEGIKAIQNIKDSIEQVGGRIESVDIEASTDKEPIKMGNQKLAELRVESVAKYFNDVDSVNVDIKADQGPDVYSKTMSKSERDSARKETAQYRYVKITINATYQDTLTRTDVGPEEVIQKNTYTLVKTIKKKSTGISIKRKGSPRIKHRGKCKIGGRGVDACPNFGQKKYRNF